MEQIDSTNGNRAQCVAVIGIAKRQKSLPLGVAAVLVKLKRHLQRNFDGGASRVRVKHSLQARRGQCHELLSELDRGWMAQAKQRRV